MKVTVCQKCGDEGFTVALVDCEMCQIYAIHRYCLDVLPASFDECVTWYCADCEPKVVKPHTADNNSTSKSDFENLTSALETQDAVQSGMNNCKKAQSRKRNKSKNRNKNKSKKKKKKMDMADSVTDFSKCESNLELSESVADTPLCGNNLNSQLVDVDFSDNCVKYRLLGHEKESVEEAGDNSGEEAESAKFIVSHTPTLDPLTVSIQKHSVHAQPIVDPIWWGTFRFLNEDLSPLSGLVAHLSSFACPKVVAESKLLPEMLSLELLPRSEVWPKSFQKSKPTGENIGLYFFPDSDRAEKVFDTLVNDMIDRDMAMRGVVENAELLIFSSTVLPLQYWRFKLKFYLWGLFRAKQAMRSLTDEDSKDQGRSS